MGERSDRSHRRRSRSRSPNRSNNHSSNRSGNQSSNRSNKRRSSSRSPERSSHSSSHRHRRRSNSRSRSRSPKRSSHHSSHQSSKRSRRSKSRSRSTSPRRHSRASHQSSEKSSRKSHHSRSPSPSKQSSDRPSGPSTNRTIKSPSSTDLTKVKQRIKQLIIGSNNPSIKQSIMFSLFKLDSGETDSLDWVHLIKQSDQQQEPLPELLCLTVSGSNEWHKPYEMKLFDQFESCFAVDQSNNQSTNQSIDQTNDRSTSIDLTTDDQSIKQSVGQSSQQQSAVMGPQLPANFQSMKQSITQTDNQSDSDDDYGPRSVDDLTSTQSIKLAELQRTRLHLQSLKQSINQSRAQRLGNQSSDRLVREEWMTMTPDVVDFNQSFNQSMVEGTRRSQTSFSQSMGRPNNQPVNQSDWTMSPAERELRRSEDQAIKQAEIAVAKAEYALDRTSKRPNSQSINQSNDQSESDLREDNQSITAAKPSMVELHQQAQAKKVAAPSSTGPIFWDRSKEMSLRRHKTDDVIQQEINMARAINDRFQMG